MALPPEKETGGPWTTVSWCGPSAIPREQKNVAQSAESMRHSESREHFWRIADGYDLLGDVMEARARRMPDRQS
jgi:hypothetical protein